MISTAPASTAPTSTAPTSTATTPTASSTPADAAPTSRRRWLALAVLALAQFLVVLDASVVNIALPVLGADLGMDTATLAWVITAYVLPFGSLLLLGGRLADRFGHRRVFLVGTTGFVLASIGAAVAVDDWMLLAARAVQGAAAATLAPGALALVTRLFPESGERSKALGIWGGVAGLGSAAGVLLGGVLTAAIGWEAVFLINVPVGIVVLVAIPVLIARDPAGARGRLDVPGAVTITVALLAAVGGITAGEQLGLVHPLTLSLASIAAAVAVVFVVIERRSASPLVPLGVFRAADLRTGNLTMLLVGGAMVALFFALSVQLQEVLGFDALAAGLSQLPLAGVLVMVAGVAPLAIARLGLRVTLAASLAVLIAGLAWLAAAPAEADFATHVLGPTLLIGIGLGGAFVPATQLATNGVGADEGGLAGGLVNTSQQIGGALGLALLASLSTARTDALLAEGVGATAAAAGGFSWLYLGAAGLAALAAASVLLGIRRR